METRIVLPEVWHNLVFAFIFVFLDALASLAFKLSVSAQLVKAFTTGVNWDLPTLPSFWGKMSLSLSNSLSFASIPLVKIGKNSQNSHFFYFRSPISPWRGPQRKSLFGAFFLDMLHIFTMPKISLRWGPLQPFLNIDPNFDKIVFPTMWWKYFGANFGSWPSQKMQNFFFGGFIEWETRV